MLLDEIELRLSSEGSQICDVTRRKTIKDGDSLASSHIMSHNKKCHSSRNVIHSSANNVIYEHHEDLHDVVEPLTTSWVHFEDRGMHFECDDLTEALSERRKRQVPVHETGAGKNRRTCSRP